MFKLPSGTHFLIYGISYITHPKEKGKTPVQHAFHSNNKQTIFYLKLLQIQLRPYTTGSLAKEAVGYIFLRIPYGILTESGPQKDMPLPDRIPNHIYSFPEEYDMEECGM